MTDGGFYASFFSEAFSLVYVFFIQYQQYLVVKELRAEFFHSLFLLDIDDLRSGFRV
jgi:hypothetical protein